MLDDSDASSVTLLHSIFSPKFHAQSAKKKKKKGSNSPYREQQQRQQRKEEDERGDRRGDNHHSIFSPISTGSKTGGRTDDDANDSVVSEMSDEFSTIHAILRGDTIQNIKKFVGLDEANHPLPSRSEGNNAAGMGTSNSKVSTTNHDAMNLRYQRNEPRKNCDDDNTCSIVDDSTEVMLDQARHLSSNFRNQEKGSVSSHRHDQNTIFTPPPGNHKHEPTASTSHVTKTPKVTPPTSDDEFYTPASSDKPDRVQDDDIMLPRLSSTSPFPMALTFDFKKGLPPVREEEEGKVEEDASDWDEVVKHIQSLDNSIIDMNDFLTPKQQCMDRQLDDYDNDDYDDDEEFFSPLVLHPGHNPSNQQCGNNPNKNMMNTVHSSLTALDFNNESMLDDSYKQTPASHLETPTLTALNTNEDPAKNDSTTYSFVKKELQSLLMEAKILTPPDKSRHSSVSNPSSTPPSNDASSFQSPTSFHLHSPSVSNLPHDALTVDFVKSCSSTKTLQAILGLLSDNKGKRGKRLRYPSLVRLVEKQLQIMMLKGQDGQVAKYSSEGADKENVDPLTMLNHDDYSSAQEIIVPDEHGAILNDDTEVGVINDESTSSNGSSSVANGSTSLTKSSLDMNLSESLFLLDDESYYWKQGAMMNENKNQLEKDTQTHESDGIFDSNEEWKDNVASTIASNSQREKNHLAIEQTRVETKPSSNLERVTEHYYQQHNAVTTDKHAHLPRTHEIDKVNQTLLDEIERLHQQIHHLKEKTGSTTQHLQSELEEARHQHSSLFQDKEKLDQELYEIRSMYEKALMEIARLKLLLDKKNEGDHSEKARRIIESAKLANKALANALAVSEKDLADACAAKEKSECEYNALRDRSNKLEEKTSYLLSELKKVTEELSSSHAYIDKLYAGLEASRIRSQEMTNDFQRREKQWIESKRGFSRKIEELESQIGSDSQHKVSMDAYLSVVKQTRHYKFESMRYQQAVNSLKDQLENIRKQTVSKWDDQSARVPTVIQTSTQLKNDENVVPSNNPKIVQMDHRSKTDVTGMRHQQGKQLSRISAVRAAGGRKGLSEQLKKSRRFSEKQVAM